MEVGFGEGMVGRQVLSYVGGWGKGNMGYFHLLPVPTPLGLPITHLARLDIHGQRAGFLNWWVYFGDGCLTSA